MTLSILFNISLTAWEEKLVALAFLTDKPITESGFSCTIVERANSVFAALNSIPTPYARELCLATLLHSYFLNQVETEDEESKV